MKKPAATAPRCAMDSWAMANAAESSALRSRVLLPSVYELPSRAMPTSWMTIGLPRRSAASMCASRYVRTRANQVCSSALAAHLVGIGARDRVRVRVS